MPGWWNDIIVNVWNDSVSDITEKFSLFCNFSASCSITTPAVYFWVIIIKLWYYWTATTEILNCWIELLSIVNKLNKSVMKQSTCGAVFCQPGGDELKHDIPISA